MVNRVLKERDILIIFLLDFPSGSLDLSHRRKSVICWSPSDRLFLLDNCVCILLSLLSICKPLCVCCVPSLISHSGMQRLMTMTNACFPRFRCSDHMVKCLAWTQEREPVTQRGRDWEPLLGLSSYSSRGSGIGVGWRQGAVLETWMVRTAGPLACCFCCWWGHPPATSCAGW